MIHIIGGDAVGMSTVQECIVANHMGIPVFAMSVITDLGLREDHTKITHEEVLHFAKRQNRNWQLFLRNWLEYFNF
jgi:purine-nucleoside phosphorylase